MWVARLAGRVAGAPRFPWSSLLVDGMSWRCSGGVRDGRDVVPGADDVAGPGPGRGDLQGLAPGSAYEAAGCVQDAVAQRLWLGPCEVCVQSREAEPGQEGAGDHRGGEPGGVGLHALRGKVAHAGVLAGAHEVLDAGVNAVGGVDVGVLPPPAPRALGEVGCPEG